MNPGGFKRNGCSELTLLFIDTEEKVYHTVKLLPPTKNAGVVGTLSVQTHNYAFLPHKFQAIPFIA
jgi:hypothetical protein